jgi:hypothetical protein
MSHERHIAGEIMEKQEPGKSNLELLDLREMGKIP